MIIGKYISALWKVALLAFVASCGGRGGSIVTESQNVSDTLSPVMDTAEFADEPEPSPGDADYVFEDDEAVRDFLRDNPDGEPWSHGILPVVAREVPDYAARLIANQHTGFIVVDKASMRVLLYDRYGNEQRSYDMACAKNYGTKHKKADMRTPEGFFSVEGKYDSTEWLFTDDDGVTSKKKGQFGPRFIRLRIPGTTQIGIHGTCAPWSLGHRVSHGCIRIANENILELVDMVEVGMPVIVLPGLRDRKVNREEGVEIPYFPTNPKYAMSASEKAFKASKEEVEAENAVRDSDAVIDSVRVEAEHPEIQTTDTVSHIRPDAENSEQIRL